MNKKVIIISLFTLFIVLFLVNKTSSIDSSINDQYPDPSSSKIFYLASINDQYPD